MGRREEPRIFPGRRSLWDLLPAEVELAGDDETLAEFAERRARPLPEQGDSLCCSGRSAFAHSAFVPSARNGKSLVQILHANRPKLRSLLARRLGVPFPTKQNQKAAFQDGSFVLPSGERLLLDRELLRKYRPLPSENLKAGRKQDFFKLVGQGGVIPELYLPGDGFYVLLVDLQEDKYVRRAQARVCALGPRNTRH